VKRKKRESAPLLGVQASRLLSYRALILLSRDTLGPQDEQGTVPVSDLWESCDHGGPSLRVIEESLIFCSHLAFLTLSLCGEEYDIISYDLAQQKATLPVPVVRSSVVSSK